MRQKILKLLKRLFQKNQKEDTPSVSAVEADINVDINSLLNDSMKVLMECFRHCEEKGNKLPPKILILKEAIHDIVLN